MLDDIFTMSFDEYVHFWVTDKFNQTIVNETRTFNEFQDFTIDVYNVLVYNQHDDFIHVNISRYGFSWSKFIAPRSYTDFYLYVGDYNMTITLNDTKLITSINVDDDTYYLINGTTLTEINQNIDVLVKREVYVQCYNNFTGLGIDNQKFKIYINNQIVRNDVIFAEENNLNVSVYDYFDRLVYNKTISFTHFVTIPINLATVTFRNEIDSPIMLKLKSNNITRKYLLYEGETLELELVVGTFYVEVWKVKIDEHKNIIYQKQLYQDTLDVETQTLTVAMYPKQMVTVENTLVQTLKSMKIKIPVLGYEITMYDLLRMVLISLIVTIILIVIKIVFFPKPLKQYA